MDRIMRARPSSSMVIALIALFVALSGTAVALDGSNTVFSDDIVNGEVKNGDLATDSVASGKIKDGEVKNAEISAGAVKTNSIGDGEVRTADVRDDSLTPADLADVGFLESNTETLTDAAGGGLQSRALLTIGRVGVNAACQNNGGGSVSARVQALSPEVGPVFVADDESEPDEDQENSVYPLNPESVDIVLGLTDTTVAAEEFSFGILDDGGTSATGALAASVNPSIGRCMFSIQAVG
jgi:hypothetical protein